MHTLPKLSSSRSQVICLVGAGISTCKCSLPQKPLPGWGAPARAWGGAVLGGVKEKGPESLTQYPSSPSCGHP